MECKDNKKRNKKSTMKLVDAQFRQSPERHGFNDLIVGDPKTCGNVQDDKDCHQPMDHLAYMGSGPFLRSEFDKSSGVGFTRVFLCHEKLYMTYFIFWSARITVAP